MLTISVENIKITAFIGVYEVEKIAANSFSIDVSVKTVFLQAMLSDEVEDTLDYAAIYQIVVSQMQIGCNLLEKKIHDIAYEIFQRFMQVREVEIKIRKLSPLNMPLCDFSSVEIRSNREDFFLFMRKSSLKKG